MRSMPNLLFSDPLDQDIRAHCALNLKTSGIRVAVGDCIVFERL